MYPKGRALLTLTNILLLKSKYVKTGYFLTKYSLFVAAISNNLCSTKNLQIIEINYPQIGPKMSHTFSLQLKNSITFEMI